MLYDTKYVLQKKIKKVEEKVQRLSHEGDEVDTDLQTDLFHIMNESTYSVRKVYAKGTFARLLWDEQFKAA